MNKLATINFKVEFDKVELDGYNVYVTETLPIELIDSIEQLNYHTLTYNGTTP